MGLNSRAGEEPLDPLQIQAPPAAPPWPARAAASQQEGRATVGLLNIICSPYLFFYQQAFSLTLCAQFVLLLAPHFPFLKTSMFVFMMEGDPLGLCVAVCTGGAAAITLCLLPHRSLTPWPRTLCPPALAEGLWRACKPRDHCWPCLRGRGQVLGRMEGVLAAPAHVGGSRGCCPLLHLARVVASAWGESQLYLTLRGFLLLLLPRLSPALLVWDAGGWPATATQPC